MFYCQPCGDHREWPTYEYLPRSNGPCEVCDKYAACYDVPSRHLPIPKDTSEQDAIDSIKQTIEKRS